MVTKEEAWIRRNVMTKEKYAAHLQDRRWYEKRHKILGLRGTYCLKCGNTNNLHIHHLTYVGKYPWDTPDEDLICLCNNCHTEIHDENSNFNREDGYKLINDFNNLEDNLNIILCFKGNKFIKECSIEEFKKDTNATDLSISKCCSSKTKTCKGFVLKYAKINRVYEDKKSVQEFYSAEELEILERSNKITKWENSFLMSLIGKNKISEKQRAVLVNINKRIQ